jgi:hypothetical protein
MLLHCEGCISTPSRRKLSKGEPEAKIAVPSDQSYACSAVHSAALVGLDRGKTMGRSVCLEVSLTISSVKRLPQPLKPRRMVGFTSPIVLARSSPSGRSSRAKGSCSAVRLPPVGSAVSGDHHRAKGCLLAISPADQTDHTRRSCLVPLWVSVLA